MKLSNLKQQLLERNSQLPENQRWTSSLREEFKMNLENKTNFEPKYNSGLLNSNIDESILQSTTLDASTYNQSNELSGLSKSKQEPIPVESKPLSKFIEKESINKIDAIKIIGITGSSGKSTTAFIVHEYLKSLGKKSVLYSSIRIDSPASYINVNEPCEIPVQNENILLDVIEEAEAYDADYIVMEVNESTIQKGLTEGIPFAVRALTNLNPKHNEEQYSPEEYVRIKESFFENIPNDEDCTCVIGLTGPFTRDDFNKFIKLNNHPKITFGSKYICEVRNADYTNLDCLLYGMNSDLNGLNMKIRVKENSYDFNTKVIFSYNALNFTCAIAIIEALNLFDANLFSKCISDMAIPGREEIIKVNNRTIVIGLHLVPVLEHLKQYQKNREINKIKVVVGSIGTGFVSWGKEFSSNLYMSQRGKIRSFAMGYLQKYADFAYLTSNDNAAENPLNIAQELQGYLSNKIPSTIVVDRSEAIKKAILESEPNDLIYISGRGNRRIFCDSANTMKLINDKEIVQDVLKVLG